MEEAISSFTLPDAISSLSRHDSIFEWYISNGLRSDKSKSALYSHGVVASSKDTTFNYFFCMASPECRSNKTKIKLCNKRTSNGTTHLFQNHQVSTSKKNKMAINKEVKSSALDMYSSLSLNKKRKDQILEVFKFVQNLWPFHNMDSSAYQLDRMLNEKDAFSTAQLKHVLCEVYYAFRKDTKKIFINEKVQIMVDIWTETATSVRVGRKFLGVRASCTNDSFEYCSRLVAVREFLITSNQSESENWTELLCMHLTDILEEFGIKWENVFGATSDAGSDIKKMLEDKIGMWNWCVSHLLHRMAEQVSTMSSIQALVKKFSSVNTFLKNSRTNGLRFAENKTVGKGIKRFAKQRWLGFEDTLDRIIINYDVLVKVYLEADDTDFPFYGDKKVLEQYRLLFHSLTIVSKAAQDPVPDACQVLRMIFSLRTRLLDDAPLLGNNFNIEIDCSDIFKEVKDVRRELLCGLDKRFFARYDDPSSARLPELAMLFNPMYKGLGLLDRSLKKYWKDEDDCEERIAMAKENIYDSANDLYDKVSCEKNQEDENVCANLLDRLNLNASDYGASATARAKVSSVSNLILQF